MPPGAAVALPHAEIGYKIKHCVGYARRYYQETTGNTMDDELNLLLQEAMNQIHSSANE